MRMTKKINQNNYFHKLNLSNDVILDSLTKTINRRYIVSYLTYLVSKKIPFSMAIIDIDNFKNYNDSYGHLIGDKIISRVADIICETATDNCYVGRYGGDEFIVIYEGNDDYDVTWQNLKNIFTAVRKTMNIDILSLNVTCTAGSAAFPKDGDSLDEIFTKSDKTLYRGKMKGRNCFIIYVKEKHKDLDYVKEDSIPVRMDRIANYFKGEQDNYYEIYESLLYLVNDLKTDAAGLFEPGKSPLLYRTDVDYAISGIPEDVLEEHYKNDMIIVNERGLLNNHSKLRIYMEDHNIRSLICAKVTAKSKYFGYVLLYQDRNRVWQEDDLAIIKYLTSLIGFSLYYTQEEE